MIGNDAFCPESGAPLTEAQHYDADGQAWRAVRSDDTHDGATEGLLTNGSVQSTRTALLDYFRRCHRRSSEPDEALYGTVSLALWRLKRVAEGAQAWDVHIWYALQHHLARSGHDVAWMGSYATLRCPDCHGTLAYRTVGDGVVARCGTRCTDRRDDRLTAIRETVATLYADAFEDGPDRASLLRF